MAENVTLNPVVTFSNDTTAVNVVNGNYTTITNAFADVMSLSGVSPNQMKSQLDMNGNNIINLPPPATINSPARLTDVVTNPTITVPPTGTSGTVVGFLNGNNTVSGNNTYSGTSTFTGAASFSQPVTLTNTLTLPAGTITGSEIANNTITNTNIAAATITGASIASNTITNSNIALATITGSSIANNTISNGNITAGTITGGSIASGTITGGNIASVTITNANIANNTVGNGQLAQMAANTIKGNNTGSTANTADLTQAQVTAMLNPFTTSLQGLTPASGGGTVNFLRADGTWVEGNQNVATLSLTGQTASIGSTLLFTPSVTGVYLFNYYLVTTTAGTGGTVAFNINYSDTFSAKSFSSGAMNLNALNDFVGPASIYCAGGVAVNYTTTVTGATGSPVYAVFLKVTQL